MPSWNVHLEAGEKIADRLKLTNKARKEFLFSCLLPDINNGYINNPKIKKSHKETHYSNDDQDSSKNFYTENQERIKAIDPFFLGYYFHLFLDDYFNADSYKRINPRFFNNKGTKDEIDEIKHHDFWLYEYSFTKNLDISKDEAIDFANHANMIEAVSITPEDILEVVDILAEQRGKENNMTNDFVVYSKESLDNLMDEACESFIQTI